MSHVAIWVFMCIGTVVPPILIGTVSQAGLNRRQTVIWSFIGFLAATIPSVLAQLQPYWIKWVGAAVGTLLLVTWLVYFAVASGRAIQAPATEVWRGFWNGLPVSVGYATVAVWLAASELLDPTTIDLAASLWIGFTASWVVTTYKRLVNNQDGLPARRDLDRVFIASYVMYVGQIVSVLAGIALLHLNSRPFVMQPELCLTVGVVIVFNVLVTFWAGRRNGRLSIVRTLAPVLLVASTAMFFVVPQRPPGGVVPVVMGALSALALLHSISGSSFRLNERSMSAFHMTMSALLVVSGGSGIHVTYSILAAATAAHQREQIALLIILCMLAWWTYLLSVSILVAAPSDEILTRNGPVFNVIHDSVLIVAALWVGFLSLGWGGFNWKEGLFTLCLTLAGIIVGLFPVIRAGVEAMINHIRSPQSTIIDPRKFDLHAWIQWLSLLVIAVTPWIAIPLGLA